ncbi:MAG: protein phosphatase 2C domain-containing protein [Chromatiaceae bacterium]
MWAPKLEFAWRTDQGRVRAHNEDAVSVHPEWGLVVVADGVGGARAGEVASQLAVDAIAACCARQGVARGGRDQALALAQAAVAEANLAVWERAQENPGYVGMGTTVVMGLAGTDWLAFANVGDSRLYRLRDGALEQLSRDHSFIQEVVDQGFFRTLEDARLYGIGDNILTRALGASREVQVHSDVVDTRPGDLFLFCTDGLSGLVPADWLLQVLSAARDQELGPAAEALVELANERGGTDNITLALLRIGDQPAEPAAEPPAMNDPGGRLVASRASPSVDTGDPGPPSA